MTMEKKRQKLSPAQSRFMADLDRKGQLNPPWGFNGAGRAASCWHRTARSLQSLGLVSVLRNGAGYKAVPSGISVRLPGHEWTNRPEGTRCRKCLQWSAETDSDFGCSGNAEPEAK